MTGTRSLACYASSMIERTDDGPVTTLRLAHGKASALDLELLEAIPPALEEAQASGARALVLTGTGSIFSAGVDLKRLVEGGDAYLDAFMPALSRALEALFFLPLPLVGAANGHAIAGGCIMLESCDVRLAAAGRGRIGVPELAVGVPFPLLALEIVRFAAAPHRIQEILFSGAVYTPEESLERGLVDAVVDADTLEEAALARARALAAFPPDAFAFNKAQLRRPVRAALEAHGAADAQRVRELWASPPVREAVEAYVARQLR